MARDIWRGRPESLGVHWDGQGLNIAVFSEHATAVDFCLFNEETDGQETERIRLPFRTDHIWYAYLPGLGPGQLYGLRVHGPNEPARGHRFNPSKLLIDPYALAVHGHLRASDETMGFAPATGVDSNPVLLANPRDSAPTVPKCVALNTSFDWSGDRPPQTRRADLVIYEMHVKGFTRLMPGVPEELRGTYAGLGSDAAIDHLRRVGVNAVELLPVQAFCDEAHLANLGKSNYWGYSPVAWFAPEYRYAANKSPGAAVAEFKGMVRALHGAGIEVFLDVVYNHTGEGGPDGPTLCHRGIDNLSYYRTMDDRPSAYLDFTGTGNSLNMEHPRVLQLIADSLRYWVTEMHVDGFRFDLATTLGREGNGFSPGASLFDILLQDPVLSRVKLIAEPWDVGLGGYQVGCFPHPWSEWNGQYRDVIRDYWRSEPDKIPDLASRIAGNSDIYAWKGKGPTASVNFITSHDGFTMRDLVSYNHKHNEANGEHNRDGENFNRSWNCGAEGPTDDAAIQTLRRRQHRNFLATLLLSQGIPMLVAGDERGRTQGGNNNAYCQDNELSWLSWEETPESRRLLDYTAQLISLRLRHPVFRRERFFRGQDPAHPERHDLLWFHATGRVMDADSWADASNRCVGMMVCGDCTDDVDEHGQAVMDDTFLVLFSADARPMPFTLPGARPVRWELLMDTSKEDGFLEHPQIARAGDAPVLTPRSVLLYRLSASTPKQAVREAKALPAGLLKS